MATDANLKATIAEWQSQAQKGTERLAKTFSFVPDDKLTWSPSKTARTPLALIAHCAQANQMFAMILRGKEISPMPTPDQMHAEGRKHEATIRTRAEAVRQLEASRENLVAALAALTPALLATSPNSPFGPMPMSFWAALPALHMGGHATQMDYIQTIWGDLVDHM